MNVPWYLRLCVLGVIAAATGAAAADGYAPEVFRGDAITVQAGLQSSSSQVVHFGDMLVLTVIVSYDPARVAMTEPEPAFFTRAWPEANGVALADWRLEHGSAADPERKRIDARIGFQVLGCPDDTVPTCPGNRNYLLPEFELEYRALDTEHDAAQSIRFRPWPETLTIVTTLEHDEEGQLLPFEAYFPIGGYPDPLTGKDSSRAAVVTAGVTLAVLTGGLLMWPFRTRTREKSVADVPRWQRQFDALRDVDAGDRSYLDALRRCLVWYCNDELELDAFLWLDLAEPGEELEYQTADDRRHAELRALFVELLHNPAGQGAELRTRLGALIGQAGRG